MRTMKTSVAVLAACLVVISTGTAFAQRAGPTPPSKVVSKTHQPVGTPHKASSFAPHPTTRRVFGDPIQPPIVNNAAASQPKAKANKKKSPPK